MDSSGIEAPKRRGFGLLLFALGLGFLLIQLVLTTRSGVIDGAIVGPDSYMRLNRVIQLEGEGGLIAGRFDRINPPVGHTQHWSAPMDLLLLGASKALEPLLGFRAALYQSALWINALLCVVALAALLRVARRFAAEHPEVVPLTGFVFVLQLVIHTTFMIGRPDHQGLLYLCNAVALLWTIDLTLDEGAGAVKAALAGLASALAIWVSVESMLVIAVISASLGFAWLGGRRERATTGLVYTVAITLALLPILYAEDGAAFLHGATTDRVSAVFLRCFAVLSLAWLALLGLSSRRPAASLGVRASGAALAVGVAAALFLVIDGAALFDPLGNVDSLYRSTRLVHIGEYQSVVASTDIPGFLGLSILAAGYCVWRLARGHEHREFLLLSLVGTVVFAAMTARQLHWAQYGIMFAILPYTLLACRLLAWLARASRSVLSSAINVVALVMLAGWPVLLTLVALAVVGDESGEPVETTASSGEVGEVGETDPCDLQEIARFLDGLGDGAPLRVMTFVDYGPELLYRTRHAVYSIPNHRPQPGYDLTYRLFAAADDAEAQAIAAQADPDLLVICRGFEPANFYEQTGVDETLHARLLADRVPDWLRPLTLPAPLDSRFVVLAPR